MKIILNVNEEELHSLSQEYYLVANIPERQLDEHLDRSGDATEEDIQRQTEKDSDPNIIAHRKKFQDAVAGKKSAKPDSPSGLPWSPPKAPDTIQNTPDLRLRIKEAMMERGLKTAADLNRLISYDSVNTIERLLNGKLNWFPDVLSAVLEALNISHDDIPITNAERHLLLPEGLFTQGAILIRPIPIVDWANAASFIENMVGGDGCVEEKWDIESTELIPAPVGMRKGTVAVRVHGISMEPRIMDGDALYCSPVYCFDEIRNKKVVLVRFSDSYEKCPDCMVVKRIFRIGDTFSLLSDNRNGRDFENLSLKDISWIRSVEGKYSTDL